MGREVRRVPADWQHPKDEIGRFIPLLDECEDEAGCMPFWPDEQRTHFQMYETTSEGTPISPPLASPEALARWLVDHKASAFGSMTATYDEWLATILSGSACSLVVENGVMRSGVAFELETDKERVP